MIKKIIIVIVVIVIGFGLFYFLNKKNQPVIEQEVYSKTIVISKEYISLRYQTDNLLVNANNFKNYESWNLEMTKTIEAWEKLEKDSKELEKSALEMSENKTTFNLITPIFAYNKQEISNVFDKAPAGKKIATLAKHLGVDAKMAFKILQQDQNQVEVDAWNEAGDTFQKLETSATIIKDGCKVAGFIGGIAVTGGTSALATGSTLTKMAVIVSGADLTLEVSSDGANIGLGNNNKISAVIDSVRVITEPLSSILTIANISGNISNGFEKFSAVMVGLEQFNSTAQEGKIIGIQLPAYTKDKINSPVKVAVLEKEEIEKWIEDQGINNKSETNTTEEKKNAGVVGVWEGKMTSTSSQTSKEEESSIVFNLNSNGTVTTTSDIGHFISWEQKGDTIILHAESEFKDGQYEFALSGDTMTFIKLAGPDEDGVWQEIMAGGDFFGGKFLQISLKKQ